MDGCSIHVHVILCLKGSNDDDNDVHNHHVNFRFGFHSLDLRGLDTSKSLSKESSNPKCVMTICHSLKKED